MKRIAAIVLALFLTGCSAWKTEMEQCLELRTKLLSSQSCSFDADITADYGDKVQSFTLRCTADETGSVQFSAVKPESISGITGTVDGVDGKLTFDSSILFFPLLADNQVIPVCAPWLFIKTLRSGNIVSVGKDGEHLRLSIDDSYDDDALHLDIWTNTDNSPIRAEILFRERRILSMDVRNFRME